MNKKYIITEEEIGNILYFLKTREMIKIKKIFESLEESLLNIPEPNNNNNLNSKEEKQMTDDEKKDDKKDEKKEDSKDDSDEE